MTDPQAIISRCTRNGVTSWANVARQMGQSLDAVRRRYDPQYLHVRPWPHPCEALSPQGEPEPVDENDTSSPYAKGVGVIAEIVAALRRHGSLSVESLAGLLGRPSNSIRARLALMRQRGMVENDSGGRHNGVLEWTWRLAGQGAPAERGAA